MGLIKFKSVNNNIFCIKNECGGSVLLLHFWLENANLVEVIIFYFSNDKSLKWLKNAAEYFAKIGFLNVSAFNPSKNI